MIDDPFIANRDDFNLVEPLKNIANIYEYLDLIRSKNKFDLQPLTDISYLADIHLKRIFNISTFHITNLLAWLLVLVVCYKILNLLRKNQKEFNLLIILIFSIHPTISMSVSWVSARKHLLGTVFMVGSAYFFLKFLEKKFTKDYLIFILLLIFSLFSHPLYSMWILWLPIPLLLLKPIRPDHSFKILILPVLLIILGIWFNYSRYISIYEYHNLSHLEESFKNSSFPDPLKTFLGLGRYFLNLFLPINYAISYDHFHDYNLAGIFSGILGFIFLSRIKGDYYLSLLSFVIFPILIVLWKIQVTINDTYLLWPIIGLIFFFSFQKLIINPITIIATSFIFLWFFYVSFTNARAWRSSEDLYRMSFSNARDCITASELALELYKKQKFSEAVNVSEYVIEEKCQVNLRPLIVENFMYFNPRIPITKKLDFFKSLSTKNNYYQFIYASLALETEGDKSEAFQVFSTFLKENQNKVKDILKLPPSEKFLLYCKKNLDKKNCHNLNMTIKQLSEKE